MQAGRFVRGFMGGLAALLLGPGIARGASRAIEFQFTPTAHAQMALWIEAPDGTFLKTVGLTQSVGTRGIGNRPGASQMNSGYRWPYGRREGVLPVWAHHRAAAPGAQLFPRVIFQNRVSEGFASRSTEDSSPDNYFCLSFAETTGSAAQSTRDKALDAVTCASGFNSDKGRFITQSDVNNGYGEPAEIAGQGLMRPLDLTSLYPPRRDVTHCTGGNVCYDGGDVNSLAQAALDVMPDLDAITMATPAGDTAQAVMFVIPDDWADGDYVAWMEVSKEGDYNGTFNDQTYPTPLLPDGGWDKPYALKYGYPYRGQPSVVYRVPFTLGGDALSSTTVPVGYGDLAGWGPTADALNPMGDGAITDDPVTAPGSGADRLRVQADQTRLRIHSGSCPEHDPPGVPLQLTAAPDTNPRHSHEWGVLRFLEPASAKPIAHYEVRVGLKEITDGDTSFLQDPPGVTASIDPVALQIDGVAAGNAVDVPFGGMSPLTTFYVGVRAVDVCGVEGPVAVTTVMTTKINFTKLSGCFIATAAYGTALEPEVQALRVARDALRARSTTFAVATDLYYRAGPVAAQVVGRSDAARAVVRELLAPVVAVTQAAVQPLAPPRTP